MITSHNNLFLIIHITLIFLHFNSDFPLDFDASLPLSIISIAHAVRTIYLDALAFLRLTRGTLSLQYQLLSPPLPPPSPNNRSKYQDSICTLSRKLIRLNSRDLTLPQFPLILPPHFPLSPPFPWHPISFALGILPLTHKLPANHAATQTPFPAGSHRAHVAGAGARARAAGTPARLLRPPPPGELRGRSYSPTLPAPRR